MIILHEVRSRSTPSHRGRRVAVVASPLSRNCTFTLSFRLPRTFAPFAFYFRAHFPFALSPNSGSLFSAPHTGTFFPRPAASEHMGRRPRVARAVDLALVRGPGDKNLDGEDEG